MPTLWCILEADPLIESWIRPWWLLPLRHWFGSTFPPSPVSKSSSTFESLPPTSSPCRTPPAKRTTQTGVNFIRLKKVGVSYIQYHENQKMLDDINVPLNKSLKMAGVFNVQFHKSLYRPQVYREPQFFKCVFDSLSQKMSNMTYLSSLHLCIIGSIYITIHSPYWY